MKLTELLKTGATRSLGRWQELNPEQGGPVYGVPILGNYHPQAQIRVDKIYGQEQFPEITPEGPNQSRAFDDGGLEAVVSAVKEEKLGSQAVNVSAKLVVPYYNGHGFTVVEYSYKLFPKG